MKTMLEDMTEQERIEAKAKYEKALEIFDIFPEVLDNEVIGFVFKYGEYQAIAELEKVKDMLKDAIVMFEEF
jgi:hypothetical protein